MAPTSAPTSPPDYGFGILETLNGPLQGADYAERYASQDIIHDVEFLLIKFTSATGMLIATALNTALTLSMGRYG
jgi:hypothetical protein